MYFFRSPFHTYIEGQASSQSAIREREGGEREREREREEERERNRDLLLHSTKAPIATNPGIITNNAYQCNVVISL